VLFKLGVGLTVPRLAPGVLRRYLLRWMFDLCAAATIACSAALNCHGSTLRSISYTLDSTWPHPIQEHTTLNSALSAP
jgi:hypothetical protein